MFKAKSFPGGYKFVNFEGQPKPILEESIIPLRVSVPLRQGFGAEGDCLVEVGEKVSAGQIISHIEKGVASPVHATINGVVEEIRRVNYFKCDCLMVSIKGDGSPGHQKVPGALGNWEQLTAQEIEKVLYLSGVTAIDREGIPTRFHSSVIHPEDVENLIVHGVGSEPYNISIEVLLQGKNTLHLIEGIKILHKIMPKARVYFALNSQRKKILEEIKKLSCPFDWLEICSLEPKYPQGYDELLVPTILKQKFPYGYSAANIGAVVLNFQAVLQAYEAVAEGKPLIERTVALCGPAFKEPLHIKVRIGASLKDVIGLRIKEAVTARVVRNSLLTGAELKDLTLPIDKTYSQIIAIPENCQRQFLAFLRPGLRSDSYSRTFLSKFLPGVKKSCETNKHGEQRPY